MTRIQDRARARRLALREELRARYPKLLMKTALPAPVDRSAIVLGRNEGGGPVLLPEDIRLQHAHVIGTTGAGKTKFLEHCIQQDIASGRGVCVIDPHGNHPDSLYRSLLGWLDERGYTGRDSKETRQIHLIDPNASTHITGFDPLALPSSDYDPTVIADAALEALERVWGEEDTNTKPTLQRVLIATLTALCELKLTLAEARLLFDPDDRAGIRRWAIENLVDEEAREEFQWLHEIAAEPRGRQDFRVEVMGPRNRLGKLTRTESVRLMLGQRMPAINFRDALDEGHIILANLSGGPRASDKSCELLGRLLTRFLFFNAQRRQRPERPFFFYLDECQLYLSGDVSRMLAEARKYGVGVILAHQYLWQLEKAGEDILHAVRNATNLKAFFRIKDPIEAADHAETSIPLDLEMPLKASIRPTSVGVELVKLGSESATEQRASTESYAEAEAVSYANTISYLDSYASSKAHGTSDTEGESVSSAEGASAMSVMGTGTGVSATDMMTPDLSLFGNQPNLIGMSEGASSMAQSSQGTGSSSMSGRGTTKGFGRSSMFSETKGWAQGEAESHGHSSARIAGRGNSQGMAQTKGAHDAYRPVFQDLPASFHSKENMLYFAAQTLRSLTTGKAFINFVDANGMKAGLLTVAPVRSRAPEEFDELRARILDTSPSSARIEAARSHVADRRRGLMEEAEKLRSREPASPKGYRTKKTRVPKKVPTRSVARSSNRGEGSS
jgi:hypothetical protein